MAAYLIFSMLVVPYLKITIDDDNNTFGVHVKEKILINIVPDVKTEPSRSTMVMVEL